MSYSEAHKVLTVAGAKIDRLTKLAKLKTVRETVETVRTRLKILAARTKALDEIERVVKSLDPHPDPNAVPV